MSGGAGSFSDHITNLLDAFIALILGAHTAMGIAVILLLFLQVLFVLACFYIRPPRTRKQWCWVLLILFAVVAICSMTIGLWLKANTAQ
jgi:hypothetical protein